jgi:UDP-N-acetylglucosamine diphosphorylase/glucosamine-1-phosphate N-acetyltransferase
MDFILMINQPHHHPTPVNKPFQLCIFEDYTAAKLSPYQLTRPCYTIPNGFYNLIERLQHYLPNTPITLQCQPAHEIFIRKRFPKLTVNQLNKSLPTLFLNGRATFSHHHLLAMLSDINTDKNYLFIKEQNIVSIFCHDELNHTMFQLLLKRPAFEELIKNARQHGVVEEKKYIQLTSHWWDYLDHLSSNLTMDFDQFPKKSLLEGDISSFTTLTNDHNMYIDHSSRVSEYVSLDASQGPIVIMDHVCIKPFVRIEGPCYIGSHSTIHSHADISQTYIGNHCKIGGEVKHCIIQSYSNKGHAGFIGHSMLGEWVNLGAGTTTSNLKLSYGHIASYDYQSETSHRTGCQFLGTIFGDFIRTGIHSLFECGTVVSSGCSLYGSNAHATYVPPFTWGTLNHYEHQRIAEFIQSLERMMARRNIPLTDEEQLGFKRLFDQRHAPADHATQPIPS